MNRTSVRFNHFRLRAFRYCIVLTVCLSGSIPVFAAEPLRSYNVDKSKISVSGISSGGYMAVQMEMAFSESIIGAGVVAAGPYNCAEGDSIKALYSCMETYLGVPSASHLRNAAEQDASVGLIDPTSNLSTHRVWLFSGAKDNVVRTEVTDCLNDFCKLYMNSSNIAYKRSFPNAQHGMITDDYGNDCSYKGDPYINNCSYDAAGEILKHIHGPLKPQTSPIRSNLKTFDQTRFTEDYSFGKEGFIYIPTACADGKKPCALHVAFHGCHQNNQDVGDQFAWNAGYNKWAEANDIIVLYPQTGDTAINHCWDWWGYTDVIEKKSYRTKNGIQTAAVHSMIQRITGEAPDPCFNATNFEHVTKKRAYPSWNLWYMGYYAKGSDKSLGFSGSDKTAVRETTPGYYVQVPACK